MGGRIRRRTRYATRPPLRRKDNPSNDVICNKAPTSSKGQFVEWCDMQQSLQFCLFWWTRMEGRIRRRTRYATRPLLLSKRQVRQSTRYATKLNFLYKERVRRICDMQQDLKKRVPSALGECCHIPFCNVSMQWKHSQQIAGTLLPRVVWMLSNTPHNYGKEPPSTYRLLYLPEYTRVFE
jgi:hypothetical protein